MVNWNVADLCVEAVKTLYQHGGIEAADLELFVIDNASSDDSLEILAEGLPEVPVIANTDNSIDRLATFIGSIRNTF